MSHRVHATGPSHTARAGASSSRLPTRPFGVREEGEPQVLDLETRMRNAELLGHRLEARPAEPVVQRVRKKKNEKKDMSTVERIRRANARSRKRLYNGVRRPKHKFVSRAWKNIRNFEANKAKSSMATAFGSVNLSKFPTKDPGPKITTVAKDYGNQSVGHKYSELVEALGSRDSEVASDLLMGVSSDTVAPKVVTSERQKNAAAKMLGISHVSEERRFGGSSKMFRGILRMVQAGKVSMKDAFTGNNPLFPMAKNPTLMRRIINLEKRKLRKPPVKPAKFEDVGSHMSDSSDDES